MLQVVWINLTVALKDPEIPPGLATHCSTTYVGGNDELKSVLARQLVDALCFDYDYPDRPGLRLLRETKAAYPTLPIVMLTMQHSEALAVWALRAKVADYLVKPVPKVELERALIGLSRAQAYRKTQSSRAPVICVNRIPDEVCYAGKPETSRLAPALYYVEKYFRSKIRGEEVAQLCGLSPFRFSRVFKDTFGITFRDYLVVHRLKEACRLLENPAASVTDVAYAAGFNDASYFTRIFRQRIGVPPSEIVGRPNVTGDNVASFSLPRIAL